MSCGRASKISAPQAKYLTGGGTSFALWTGGIDMDNAPHHARYSIFNFFSFSQKTPEEILVETQWTTVGVLVGVARVCPQPPAAVSRRGVVDGVVWL